MDRASEEALVVGARAFRLDLSRPFIDALGRYLDTLVLWNKRINLTAVDSPREVIDRHFLDSLSVVPHVPETAKTLLDVGSGAGFPGAVIALVRPTLAVTLWEPNQKKVAFLRTIGQALSLRNLTVEPRRAEAPLPDDSRFDCATSRATLALPDWLQLGRGLVRPGGTVLGMEGADQHPLPENATRYLVTESPRRAIIIYRP
jgi:16S rRNA (guanine527-N7)-methyltransferase